MERLRATYLIETPIDPAVAADAIAGEQSSGTFVAVPGETPQLKARFGARVETVSEVDAAPRPALPGAAHAERYRRAQITISWPLETVGVSLAGVLATVAGNLFELRQVSGLKILDLEFPAAFAGRYEGPRFGVEGTRRLAGVAGRPLIGTIIKPSVGLSPDETAALVDTLCGAGIDFIKDDELQADGPHCPFEARARAVLRVITGYAERTGKKVMYAANITGDLDEMRKRHDLVQSLGGTCIMLSLNSVGLAGIVDMRRHAELPIHAHRNGWGALGRHPLLGWSFVAWQKIWRLAGIDHVHVNGLRNKFWEADESVIASARACSTPLFAGKPCAVMPVFSSGQSAVQAPDTYRALGSTDLIYCAGGGILAHPGGPAAGVESLRAAWEAAVAGTDLETQARTNASLAAALQSFA